MASLPIHQWLKEQSAVEAPLEYLCISGVCGQKEEKAKSELTALFSGEEVPNGLRTKMEEVGLA